MQIRVIVVIDAQTNTQTDRSDYNTLCNKIISTGIWNSISPPVSGYLLYTKFKSGRLAYSLQVVRQSWMTREVGDAMPVCTWTVGFDVFYVQFILATQSIIDKKSNECRQLVIRFLATIKSNALNDYWHKYYWVTRWRLNDVSHVTSTSCN